MGLEGVGIRLAAVCDGARAVDDGEPLGADDRGAFGLYAEPGGVHHCPRGHQFPSRVFRTLDKKLVLLVSLPARYIAPVNELGTSGFHNPGPIEAKGGG